MDLSIQKAHLYKNDSVLAEIMDYIGEPVIESTGDVFFDLVSCIMEQQIHYRAKGGYMKKLMQLLDDQVPTPMLILSLDPHEFARKKISSIKYSALKSLAGYWKKEELHRVDWFLLGDDEIRSRLLPIKGIGVWTVDMILLYTLGRHNIFNPNDFQLKKVMVHGYGLAEGPHLIKELVTIAENWVPYKSLAVLYLLAWRNYLNKNK